MAVTALSTFTGFHASSQPLSAAIRQEVTAADEWHSGCPVALSQLRVLRVGYFGFDGRTHTGELVVNAAALTPLTKVFRRLYALRFNFRVASHAACSATYGPASADDRQTATLTASFECRQASASPCTKCRCEHRHRQLVGARIRRGDRSQSGREPLRRLRDDSRRDGALVPEPLPRTPRDGHPRYCRGVRLGRLGLGRCLERIDAGLHALLRHRPLGRTLTSEARPGHIGR